MLGVTDWSMLVDDVSAVDSLFSVGPEVAEFKKTLRASISKIS